jgi:hypothetical protein
MYVAPAATFFSSHFVSLHTPFGKKHHMCDTVEGCVLANQIYQYKQSLYTSTYGPWIRHATNNVVAGASDGVVVGSPLDQFFLRKMSVQLATL